MQMRERSGDHSGKSASSAQSSVRFTRSEPFALIGSLSLSGAAGGGVGEELRAGNFALATREVGYMKVRARRYRPVPEPSSRSSGSLLPQWLI